MITYLVTIMTVASGAIGAAPTFSPTAALDASTPRAFISAPDDERFRLVVVEKSTQTLRLYDGAGALLRMIPCTTGRVSGDKQREGDLKTPEGVYWLTRYIPGSLLPPLYGAGALVMDYPNDFDRLDGKTGSGIWLHGVETDERVYVHQDTRGCVAVRNDHFVELLEDLRLRETPVLIVEALELADPDDVAAEREAVREFLDEWASAWAHEDTERQASLLADGFEGDGMRREAWLARKAMLAERDHDIRIAWDDLLALKEKDRIWLRFRQEYASSGHRDVGTKLLRVRTRDAGPRDWKIVGESWVPLPEPFQLLDPTSPPMTPAEVARVAPDAAPSAERAEAPAPEEEPPAPASTEVPGSPVPAPAPGAEAPAPAAQRPSGRVAARLVDAIESRNTFLLNAPFAKVVDGEVVVEVQLLSTSPWTTREGRWTLTRSGEGADAALGDGAFTLRQGTILGARLAPPVAGRGTEIVATIWDSAGRVALKQGILVELVE